MADSVPSTDDAGLDTVDNFVPLVVGEVMPVQQQAGDDQPQESQVSTAVTLVSASAVTLAVASSTPAPIKKIRKKEYQSNDDSRRLRDVFRGDDTFTRFLPADPLTPYDTTETDTENAKAGLESLKQRKAAIRLIRLPRQVRHAAYTFLTPEQPPNPTLLAVSKSAFQLLDLDPEDPDILDVFSGSKLPSTLCRPWTSNYAGHQFGFYAGQLGDGRCISIGEVVVPVSSDKPAPLFADPHWARYEVSLKGCGRTPYSRYGDGYAVLRSSIREFICSEYMAALGVPTSRCLSIVGTTRAVYRDRGMESGAIVARCATSWIRFGTFELFWYRGEKKILKQLVDFVIDRYFPGLKVQVIPAMAQDGVDKPKEKILVPQRRTSMTSALVPPEAPSGTGQQQQPSPQSSNNPFQPALGKKLTVSVRPNLQVMEEKTDSGQVKSVVVEPYAFGTMVDVELNKYAKFFREVIRRTAMTVAHWQAIGFCHGVLNTDNMSILGLTIDYGPYMFMDVYDPWANGNHSDEGDRYRFEHQPKIALWNLSKLGRTLVELVAVDDAGKPLRAVDDGPIINGNDIIRQLLELFEPMFVEKYTELMRKKLGLRMIKDKDLEHLILPLLQLLSDAGADYHCFFRRLSYFRTSEEEFNREVGPPVAAPKGFVDPNPRGRADSIISHMPMRRNSSLLNALFPETATTSTYDSTTDLEDGGER
ncbi:hypothetical protein HDV05_005389, partial [Chytridiales sp. JEL 0842]